MKLIDWIIRLYPQAWRERYEDEMRAVLEEHEFTFLTAFDLLLGMVDARLDPYYRREGSSFVGARVSTIVFLYMLAIVFVWYTFWEAFLTAAIHHDAGTPASFVSNLIVSDGYYLLQAGLEMCAILILVIYGRRMVRKWGWRRALFAATCFILPVLGFTLITTISFGFQYVTAQYHFQTEQFIVGQAIVMGALLGNAVVAFVKLKSLRAARKVGQFRFLLGTEIAFVVVSVLMSCYYYIMLLNTFSGRIIPNGLDLQLSMQTPFNLLAIVCIFITTERWSKKVTAIAFTCISLVTITTLTLLGLRLISNVDFLIQIQDLADLIAVVAIVAILMGVATVSVLWSLRQRWKIPGSGRVKDQREIFPSMDMSGHGEEYR